MLHRRRLILGAAGLAVSASPARAQPIAAPFRLADQRVLVDAVLDGHGAYPFVVDTGAAISGIRNTLANALGLTRSGEIALNGLRRYPMYSVREAVIGGAVRQHDVGLFGMDDINLGGEGLFAAGLVTSLVSELDFETLEWRVHPGGAAPPPDYALAPGQLVSAGPGFSRRIYIDATLDDVRLRPVWDTGGPRPMVISHALGKRLGYLERGVPYAPVRGGGIAGPAADLSRLVRARTLQIGPFPYRDTFVMVRPEGAAGEEAVLGLPLMQTLNLFVDGPRGQIWLKRSGRQPTGAVYALSGVWAEQAGGAIRVREVGAGSPAAQAGVRAGDIIQGAGDLRAVIALLAGPPGAPVSLRLRRPQGETTAAFILAAYL